MRILFVLILFFGSAAAFAEIEYGPEGARLFQEFRSSPAGERIVWMNPDGRLTTAPAEGATPLGTMVRGQGEYFSFRPNANPFPNSDAGSRTVNVSTYNNATWNLQRATVNHWNRHVLAASFPPGGGTAYVWHDGEGRIMHVGTEEVAPSPRVTNRTVVTYNPATGFHYPDTYQATGVGAAQDAVAGLRVAPEGQRVTVFAPLPQRRLGYHDVIRVNERVVETFLGANRSSQNVWYHIGDGSMTTEAPRNPTEYLTGQLNRDSRGNVTFNANPAPEGNRNPLFASHREAANGLVRDSVVAHSNRAFARANFGGTGNHRVWIDSTGRYVSTAATAPRPGLFLNEISFRENGVFVTPVHTRPGDAIPVHVAEHLEDMNLNRRADRPLRFEGPRHVEAVRGRVSSGNVSINGSLPAGAPPAPAPAAPAAPRAAASGDTVANGNTVVGRPGVVRPGTGRPAGATVVGGDTVVNPPAAPRPTYGRAAFAGLSQPYQRQTSSSQWADFRGYLRNPLNHPQSIMRASAGVGMGFAMVAIAQGYQIIGQRIEGVAIRDQELLNECNLAHQTAAYDAWTTQRNRDLTCNASAAHDHPKVQEHLKAIGEANWEAYVSLARELSPTPPTRTDEELIRAGSFMDRMKFLELYSGQVFEAPCRHVLFNTRSWAGTNVMPTVHSLINFGGAQPVVLDHATRRFVPASRARSEAAFGPAINWPEAATIEGMNSRRAERLRDTGVNRELACVTDDDRACLAAIENMRESTTHLQQAQNTCIAHGVLPDLDAVENHARWFARGNMRIRPPAEGQPPLCPRYATERLGLVATVRAIRNGGFPEGPFNNAVDTAPEIRDWCRRIHREPRVHAGEAGTRTH